MYSVRNQQVLPTKLVERGKPYVIQRQSDLFDTFKLKGLSMLRH